MFVRRSLQILAVTTCLVAFAGCGSSGDESDPGTTGSGKVDTEQVRVYSTQGEHFDPVSKEVAAVDAPTAATEALLEVPADRTLIPAETKVEKVKVNGEGEAVVDLSGQFLGEIPADPAERNSRQKQAVEGRVAQVTYTLTSLKNVHSVEVRAGGVAVGRSSVRADYAKPDEAPPLPHSTGQYGARISGAAAIQQQLADLKYLPQSGVDGVIGYQTQQAVMAFQSWEGLTRDGVVGPQTRAALRKAKTPQPSAKRPKRLMEVRIGKGVLLLVRGGRTVRVVHVSAGGPGTETPTGRYEVFRKELQSWSVPFSTWLPYASYFNNGIAFHEYPDVPPYPASHGCVRVPAPEAPMVYRFARIGTVVVVRS